MTDNNKNNLSINFDDYSSNYEEKLLKSLDNLDGNYSYYHSGKAKIAKRELNINPKNILDLGCGIGSMLKFLKENFNNSKFYAYDKSQKSLEYVKQKYPDVYCLESLNTDERFDLIILTNVIHHVKSGERNELLEKISSLLLENGKLLIFEHNPYNPLTLRVVANCEFDVDAELINKKNLIKLCEENYFKYEKSGYIHFFPSKLKIFFNLEKYLKWFFLGAQYFCILKK